MSEFQYKAGLNNVGSYQVSGIPFVTGTLTAPINSGTPISVSFPTITKKILIHLLTDKAQVRVGFSSNGVKDGHHFILDTNGSGRTGFVELEVKCDKIFLLSNTSATCAVSVAAELTGIKLDHSLSTTYSGSAGIG